jgi:hypothetical protein
MWKKLWDLLNLKYDLIFNNTRTKFTMKRNKFSPHTQNIMAEFHAYMKFQALK